MRVQLPDHENEVKIYFFHPKGKNGKTWCEVRYGKIDERDCLKSTIATATVRRDSRDVNNRVVARTQVLEKALKNAVKNTQENGLFLDGVRVGLTTEEATYIWDNAPIRKSYTPQHRA